MAYITKNIRSAIFGAVALAALAPVAASAGPQDGGAVAKVSYADLNLTTPGGAAKLHARVARAAKTVCQYDSGTRQLWQMQAQNACVSKALASAEVQIAAAMRRTDAGTAFAIRDETVRH
jgi:UrcA family protein